MASNRSHLKIFLLGLVSSKKHFCVMNVRYLYIRHVNADILYKFVHCILCSCFNSILNELDKPY